MSQRRALRLLQQVSEELRCSSVKTGLALPGLMSLSCTVRTPQLHTNTEATLPKCKRDARFLPLVSAYYVPGTLLGSPPPPPFIFISWRLITLQYCSGFCHTLTWISHGFTCVPHPDPPYHLPPHPIPLGLPSAPAPSTCLMHPTWGWWSVSP